MQRSMILFICSISILLISSITMPLPSISNVEGYSITETRTQLAPFVHTPPTNIVCPASTPSPTPINISVNEPGLIGFINLGDDNAGGTLAFSPDGLILAQANSSVRLWDVNTHKLIRELKFPFSGSAQNIQFNFNGKLLAVNVFDNSETSAKDSHLLVWDTSTGKLIQNWLQEHVTMTTDHGFGMGSTDYIFSINAMTFLPSSTKLVYASGNKIMIKDALGKEEPVEWSLGKNMYASEIGVRNDSEFLYVFMKWYKGLTFPSLIRWRFRLEIWHINTKSLRKEIKFEEVSPIYADKWLVGQYLVQEDNANNSLESLNLSTDKTVSFPYRLGRKFFNSDGSLMLVTHDNYRALNLEVWNTDNWRNLYTFSPKFMDYFDTVDAAVFNTDNTVLALTYEDKILFWDIDSLKKP